MKKHMSIIISALIILSTFKPCFADSTQNNIIKELDREYAQYKSLAIKQLPYDKYLEFSTQLDSYKIKLNTMESNMQNETVYYDLKDYQLISYQMWNLTTNKYDIELTEE